MLGGVCVAGEGDLTLAIDLSLLPVSPTFVYETPASESRAVVVSRTEVDESSGKTLVFTETSVRFFLKLAVYMDLEDPVRPSLHRCATAPCAAISASLGTDPPDVRALCSCRTKSFGTRARCCCSARSRPRCSVQRSRARHP